MHKSFDFAHFSSTITAAISLIRSWRSAKASPFIIIFFLASTCGSVAFAEDWPGWRKDGSGVSKEMGIPQSWGPEENICWKTSLPGGGISSPIVWQDRVFVTAVVPGTTTRLAYKASVAVLWFLTLAGLWWYVEGTPSDPLGQHRCTISGGRAPGYIARKIILIMLFVGVAYAILVGCEQLRESCPYASARILGKPLEYNGHTGSQISVARFWINKKPGDNDRLEVNPQVPRDYFLAGFLAAFAILSVNGLVESRGRPSEATIPETQVCRRSLASWVQAVFVMGIAGTFFVAVHIYALAEPPHAETTTWYQTANICLIGLIAAVGSLHRGSAFRVFGAGIGVLLLAGLIAPFFAFHANAEWYEAVSATHFPVYWEVALVTCCGFCLEYLCSTRRGWPKPLSVRLVPSPSWAIPLAGIVFFVPVNYLVPKTALLRQLICIDRDSGSILWMTTCAAPTAVSGRWPWASATQATPTPVTDGTRIYAHFGGVGVYCADTSGRIVWTLEDPVPPAQNPASSSLVLWQDLLVLTYDVDKRSLTLALDKRTGKVRWEADRSALIKPMNYYLLDAYSTPVVVQRHGGFQLVNNSSFYLCGYDLSTGKEIWHIGTPGGQVVASPVVWNDFIIAPGGVSNGCLMAVRLEDKDGGLQAQETWRTKRHIPEISSPVVYRDHLYAVTPAGVATCRKPGDNHIMWRERISGQCDASITAADGKIYLCDVEGITTVVAAGPEFRVLARNAVGEPVQASFAISGGHLFIRGDKHLFCIGPKKIHTSGQRLWRASAREHRQATEDGL